MENRSNPNRQILEALEACRPGSDDVLDFASAMAENAELARLYERLQRVDTAIGEAFRDVPTPEGLEERILAGLGVGACDTGEEKAIDERLASPGGRFVSRRQLLASVGGVVAAGLLVGAVWFFGDSSEAPTRDELYILARGYFKNDTAAGSGKDIDLYPPPSHFPFSPDVHGRTQAKWRPIRGFLDGFLDGHDGVAYDIPLAGPPQATLYVMRYGKTRLPARPPTTAQQSTGGLHVSAWTSGELLYVLVVQGSRQDYTLLIARPSGPLT